MSHIHQIIIACNRENIYETEQVLHQFFTTFAHTVKY